MPEKYKEEIEEILKQAEEVISQERPERSAPRRPTKRYVLRLPRIGLPTGWPRISAGKVMVAAFCLFLAAIVMAATTGPVMLFIWVGLALFIAAYAMFFARPASSTRIEKRWRGRLMEDEPPDLWSRLKRWLRG